MGEGVLAVADAFADFADQKSGWFAGHSRRVSELAAGAAAGLDLAGDEVERIRLAGPMHDIGRVAVANGIWEKPAELAPRERQIARSHSLHTASVLALADAPVGKVHRFTVQDNGEPGAGVDKFSGVPPNPLARGCDDADFGAPAPARVAPTRTVNRGNIQVR